MCAPTSFPQVPAAHFRFQTFERAAPGLTTWRQHGQHGVCVSFRLDIHHSDALGYQPWAKTSRCAVGQETIFQAKYLMRKDSVNVHEILNGLRTLTPREHDVLNQVVLGRLNKEIASELGITIRTVKEHRARVMEKMEANALAELVTMIVTVRLKQPISTTLP
jgi:DNA-binding CsgD family transcriptional regulator